MESPFHQRNTKFVNNLPLYWGKYVTIIKNNKDISTVSYVDLYTHLKSYEQHAMKTLSKMNQTSRNVDPLAYMAQATQSTSLHSQYVPLQPQYAPTPQQAPQPTNDAMLATMNQIITKESVHRRAPGNKGKHAATRSQEKVVTCYNCRGQGHVAKECKEKKRAKDSQWFKDKALLMEAKKKGAILDAEVEAFLADVECTAPYAEPLAITTTTAVEVSQEIHKGEQLDFDVDLVIDDHDNTIPYHQYQLNNKVKSVLTDVSFILPGGISVITILDDLRLQLTSRIKAIEEQIFTNNALKAELERYKIQVQNLEQSMLKKDLEQLVFECNKQNADLEEQLVSLKQQLLQHVKSNKSLKTKSEKLKANKNALEESYLEELVWLRNTNKVFTELFQSHGQPVQIVPMLSKRSNFSTKDLHKFDLGHRNPLYLTSAQLCIEDNLFKEVSEYMKIFEELEKEYDQCVINKKSLEIKNKNLLIQNECLIVGSVSKDICSVVLTSDMPVPMSVEPRNLELEAEILKLKDQLQGKDELIRNLKAQIGNLKEVSADPNLSTLEFQGIETKNTQLKEELTSVRIKNDSLRDENVSIKKRYQYLYKSRAESNSNVSSGAAVSVKPKVLAPGLYAMTPKYVPPQKRNNREVNTSSHRKEKVSSVKKPNVPVNLSTGIKSVTKASKSKSRYETKTHRNLPARSENVKRVDNPLRNLNKRNRVDSSLSIKRIGFISKFDFVQNIVGSKWKPTGRNFTLGDTCPLTRITKPEVVPLEKSRSVSISEPANNVIVTPRFSKKPLTSYKRKYRKLKDISTGSPPNAEIKAVNDPVNVKDLSANQLDPNKN
nr:hypothetical protein [Tanacetum cinerariifolium]